MKIFYAKEKGFTLIEAAILILLLSIALVPVIKMVSNKAGDSANNGVFTAGSAARNLTREQAAANAIMEKAIAMDTAIVLPLKASDGRKIAFNASIPGDFVYLNTDGTFSSTSYRAEASYVSKLEAGTTIGAAANTSTYDDTTRTLTGPKFKYDHNIYYQWVLQDATMQKVWLDATHSTSELKSFMPKGNNLVKALLKVYTGDDAKTSDTPKYSVSTYFYATTGAAVGSDETFNDKIGIVLVLDTSSTMHMANVVGPSGNPNDPNAFYDVRKKGTDAGTLWNLQNGGGIPLPLRFSSGVFGYDLLSVSAPYLTYRPNKNDLYFGGKTQDVLTTPYDERYDPCYDVGVSAADQLQDATTSYLYPNNLVESTMTACKINPSAGPPSTTATQQQVFVKLPTTPDPAILANLQLPANQGASATNTYFFDNNALVANGKTCLDPAASVIAPNFANTVCAVFTNNGKLMYSNPAQVYNVGGNIGISEALDLTRTEMYRSNLMAASGNDAILQNTLSRIEAARTAMLAFVEMIEADKGLVNNFRIGFVPFSTEVLSGAYTLGTDYGPNEVMSLQTPVVGKFNDLRNKLYRINRACNFVYGGLSTNQYAVDCPTDGGGTKQKPIIAAGETNIAQGVYKAANILNTHGETLSKKLVILLTDGVPNKGVNSGTGVAQTCADFTACKANLATVSAGMASSNVSVYTVGLLTAGNTQADEAFEAIRTADTTNNQTIKVSSVGDLTPVFEGIAQQAEQFVLEQMKKRYAYLDYPTY